MQSASFYFLCLSLFLAVRLPADLNTKERITDYQRALQEVPPDQQGELLKELASAYYKDQEEERAVQTFLEALDAPFVTSVAQASEDHLLYSEALTLYLSQDSASAHQMSQQLLNKYGPVYAEHPNFYELGYLVALAQANLEQWPVFFDTFYHSYTHMPTHYLAYKTKAMLHAKLYVKGWSPEAREKERYLILKNIEQALEQNAHDSSLYKMLFSFTPELQRGETIERIIDQIVACNIMIPRADIRVYVEQAIDYKRSEAADRLIQKGLEWYPNSRALRGHEDGRH